MDALAGLPPGLPQAPFLRELAADLWAAEGEVTAAWLGGSLARGDADEESDVDLRVAVSPDAFAEERLPAAAGRIAERAVVHLPFPWGEGTTLHHLLLDDGQVYDLLVQRADADPRPEARRVLFCRDPALAKKLAAGCEDPAPTAFPSANAAEVREILLSFWINQRKHVKALRRGLPLVAWEGEHRMSQDVLRLWFIAATGADCGPVGRLTIHTISPVVRAVQGAHGPAALALLGGPLGGEVEVVAGALALQGEVSRIGRRLAAALGFVYPDAAEATVRRVFREAFGETVSAGGAGNAHENPE